MWVPYFIPHSFSYIIEIMKKYFSPLILISNVCSSLFNFFKFISSNDFFFQHLFHIFHSISGYQLKPSLVEDCNYKSNYSNSIADITIFLHIFINFLFCNILVVLSILRNWLYIYISLYIYIYIY